MATTEIYKTEFAAHRAAKSYFQNVLNVKDVPVQEDTYLTRRYGSTTCICGETAATYFEPVKASHRRKVEAKAVNTYVMFGICESCGDKY